MVEQGLWMNPHMVAWAGPADGTRHHLADSHCGVQLGSACKPPRTPGPAQTSYLSLGILTLNFPMVPGISPTQPGWELVQGPSASCKA